jgi:hypothetical protein
MGGQVAVRLAAVARGEIDRFRLDRAPLSASLIQPCSPLVARFVELEPLRTLLGIAVESGEPLANELWHELRVPTVHLPDEVQTLAGALGDAWLEAEQTPVACDDFFIGEIKRVVSLFSHAAAQQEAVVAAILPVLLGPEGPIVNLFHDH